MNYQTYLIAYDGHWCAVVSAEGEMAAERAFREHPGFSEGIEEDDEIEVRRVPPGTVHDISRN